MLCPTAAFNKVIECLPSTTRAARAAQAAQAALQLTIINASLYSVFSLSLSFLLIPLALAAAAPFVFYKHFANIYG